ncbi:hypothetical protein FRB96_002775 [Tulasnella sp. 330]|nr:hypothetical protein FRB96_002775 [Tulasnella sp. 330]KAG8876932.1 hypothetical protein FRB97_003820 [Tulasnella sp. 331]KAG8884608.1 hypothetical protein FRB98_002322 [Tulasnella sp. 332]
MKPGPLASRSIDRIPPNTDERVFYDKYVANRTPVIIQGFLDDTEFKAYKWKDMAYLKNVAGDAQVMVEPLAEASNQYGTGVTRTLMPFKQFLELLESEAGPYPYLTTQYENVNDDNQVASMFPPPTLALRRDFPVKPRLMGRLVLDQVNLWIGRSSEGSSSGLHHDFHDNLYCLLQGRKRFVLYPPSLTKHLYPHGDVDTVHPNGLISYQHLPVRADGLTHVDAAEDHVAIAKAKLDAANRRRAKSDLLLVLKKEYKNARKAWLTAGGVSSEMHGSQGSHDDADAILKDLEMMERRSKVDREGKVIGSKIDAGSFYSPADDAWGGVSTNDDLPSLSPDPSSFSRIQTAYLHAHLNLPTTATAPSAVTVAYPNLDKAGQPYVIDLHEGEMLYLPASWWHEVTSTSVSAPHMAFNYWFHPPDALGEKDFDEPYRDKLLWHHLRKKARKLASSAMRERARESGANRVDHSFKKRRLKRRATAMG